MTISETSPTSLKCSSLVPRLLTLYKIVCCLEPGSDTHKFDIFGTKAQSIDRPLQNMKVHSTRTLRNVKSGVSGNSFLKYLRFRQAKMPFSPCPGQPSKRLRPFGMGQYESEYSQDPYAPQNMGVRHVVEIFMISYGGEFRNLSSLPKPIIWRL